MKIGIVTFYSASNYGAVLQTYALIKFLKVNNFTIKVFDHQPILAKLYYCQGVIAYLVYFLMFHLSKNLKLLIKNHQSSKYTKKEFNLSPAISRSAGLLKLVVREGLIHLVCGSDGKTVFTKRMHLTNTSIQLSGYLNKLYKARDPKFFYLLSKSGAEILYFMTSLGFFSIDTDRKFNVIRTGNSLLKIDAILKAQLCMYLAHAFLKFYSHDQIALQQLAKMNERSYKFFKTI
jgi:hypothetical protein